MDQKTCYLSKITHRTLRLLQKINERIISRASLTNSLCQRKPFFGVKIVLSGFTKDAQCRLSAEKAWTVIFVPDLIEYAFVGVSLSDAKFMGGEYSNESRDAFY